MHLRGIVHRDIKPNNVLLNEDCFAKICDFGLSRAIGNNIYTSHPDLCFRNTTKKVNDDLQNSPEFMEDIRSTKTNTDSGMNDVIAHSSDGEFKLTPNVATRQYRAPELIVRNTNYDGKIDIWSVGCIFGELLNLTDTHEHRCNRGPLFTGNTMYSSLSILYCAHPEITELEYYLKLGEKDRFI